MLQSVILLHNVESTDGAHLHTRKHLDCDRSLDLHWTIPNVSPSLCLIQMSLSAFRHHRPLHCFTVDGSPTFLSKYRPAEADPCLARKTNQILYILKFHGNGWIAIASIFVFNSLAVNTNTQLHLNFHNMSMCPEKIVVGANYQKRLPSGIARCILAAYQLIRFSERTGRYASFPLGVCRLLSSFIRII